MRALTLVFTLAVVVPLAATDQQRDRPPAEQRIDARGSAVIAGTVSADEARSTPVRRALLTLTGTDIVGTRTTVTDDKGQFQFDALPAGRYLLTAQKSAHVTMHYGSPAMGRGPGAPIALADGQRVEVSMRLPRGAVLTGVLRGESGTPIPSGQIQLTSPSMVNGEVRWQSVRTQGPIVTTDEQGRYRIYGLAPGEYVIRGTGGLTGDVRLMTTATIEAAQRERDQRIQGQAPAPSPDLTPRVSWTAAFAPGVVDRNVAQRFSLREGQEYHGADITLSLGRVARVSGTMMAPDGSPATQALVGLVNTRERSVWSSPGGFRPDAQGAFTLPAIGPGEYAFVGRVGEMGSAMYSVTPFVVTGDDVTGLRVEFAPGGTVSGRIEGTATPIPAAARMTLTPVGGIPGFSLGTASTEVGSDGVFRFEGVAPGHYRVTASGLGTLHLQSAMLGDRETLDEPFPVTSGQAIAGLRVVVSDKATAVTGTLSDQLGRPAPEFAVVMFSTERAHWSVAPRRMTGVVRLDSNGAYRITGLPPGTYYLSAVTDASPQQLADPTFLEELAASALTITLTQGEQKRQDLKLAGG